MSELADIPCVFIVDDHPAIRGVLARAIQRQPDLTVCGEAASVEEALARIPEAEPDLVLIDVSLKGSQTGLQLVAQLNAEQPALRMIVVSGQEKAIFAQESLRLGAQGYVTKGNIKSLMEAIYTVLAGDVYDGLNGR